MDIVSDKGRELLQFNPEKFVGYHEVDLRLSE